MRCECFISAAILLECFARSSVIHSYQPQSAGGGGVSGGGAVFERENALYVFHEQGAFAYKQERTHKIPDHMMQKSVALHGVNELFAFTSEVGARDAAHVGLLFDTSRKSRETFAQKVGPCHVTDADVAGFIGIHRSE